jgi:hypothetical protein
MKYHGIPVCANFKVGFKVQVASLGATGSAPTRSFVSQTAWPKLRPKFKLSKVKLGKLLGLQFPQAEDAFILLQAASGFKPEQPELEGNMQQPQPGPLQCR